MHDLVIKGGTVFDGSGANSFEADVAVDGGVITAVGKISAGGKQEIDAKGQMVTPGFVDAHTHYDAQVTWDPYLQPSTYHGVTTAVMGNCGVGFAPCAPDRHAWLIGLMEGVEDIPGSALVEGIRWGWESFPQYMDAVEKSPLAIDVGLQAPHSAIRAYVMGERAVRREMATEEDNAKQAALVTEALQAGALGFTTSRTDKHRDKDGNHTPTFKADARELRTIAKAMGKLGHGVIQLIADCHDDFEAEFAMIRAMVEVSGRPLSITIEQDDRNPQTWKKMLQAISAAAAQGLPMRGQVPPRATGVMMGLTASLHPFMLHPSFAAIADKPLKEQLHALRTPDFRARLLKETPNCPPDSLIEFLMTGFHKMFQLGDSPDYEPSPQSSVQAQAASAGCTPQEMVLRLMEQNDGKSLLYFPLFNYQHGNLDDVATMLQHPHTTFGLSDGGAHCGILCDASFPTTLLTHWGRDRKRGPTLPLPWLVKAQTHDTACLVGLHDRGLVKAGMKADLNVIDFDNLRLYAPEIVYDLPAGGKRFIQKTHGYTASIVSGKLAFQNGEPTGALNGKLVRGAQQASSAQAACGMPNGMAQ